MLRADEAGGLYHALSRGNLRADIFKKPADLVAFEKILSEGLQKPELEPKLLANWPLPRLPNWVDRVNEALSEQELNAVRLSAQLGRPLGDEGWVESIARRLNLESTMRPRGRPRVRFPTKEPNKEA